MRKIIGKAKTVREILKGVKYAIDYYQREYKWQSKQVKELLDDLSNKFLEEYEDDHERKRVKYYPHYFLGSIIISEKESASYIIDGQQRLTSLTLLLMLLRNLQSEREVKVNIDECIFSEQFGEVSFNIDVSERIPCMQAIYENDLVSYDPNGASESIRNLYKRYTDLAENIPEELTGKTLPYFMDWLLENVHLVEITAYSDDDAYTIFETMNDRGLSLSPTDMLKGYLLANMDESRRDEINDLWRDYIRKLTDLGKDVEPDFFKAWLRSQYSQKIRERKKNAKPEDFDRIGTEFHRWVRESAQQIGLSNNDTFLRFVQREFKSYCKVYLLCIEASRNLTKGLEPIFYNAFNGFTLQHMLLLAPVKPDDHEKVVKKKLWLVSRYLDILLAWRIWNFRRIAYSTMQYTMFNTMREIRGLDVSELSTKLHSKLVDEWENFSDNSPNHRPGIGFSVHQQNRFFVHGILARITDYIERESGMDSHYLDYVRMDGKNRYEVEHIWANHPERHTHDFEHSADFQEHRNRISGLLLLPKSFNASFGDLPYSEKLPHYMSQNLLARSLNHLTYERHPRFIQFISRTGLQFQPYTEFNKYELDARYELYQEIAELVWNPEDLLVETDYDY